MIKQMSINFLNKIYNSNGLNCEGETQFESMWNEMIEAKEQDKLDPWFETLKEIDHANNTMYLHTINHELEKFCHQLKLDEDKISYRFFKNIQKTLKYYI